MEGTFNNEANPQSDDKPLDGGAPHTQDTPHTQDAPHTQDIQDNPYGDDRLRFEDGFHNEDRLRRYVDGLFIDTTPTKKSVELKEEMIQNLTDKYSDLIADGKTQEAAYNIVVAGIGDISVLLDELSAEAAPAGTAGTAGISGFAGTTPPGSDVYRLRSALFTAIAVMGYILAPLPLIILSMFRFSFTSRVGVPILFIMFAMSTGLLVFNAMSKPRYLKKSQTMVDEFREWQSDSQARKHLRRAISAALWAVVVALYFIISFSVDAWHLTWIIFILGAAAEAFINLFFTLRK